MTTLTEAAAQKVESIVFPDSERLTLSRALFRAYVEGGGCSGLKYGFTLEQMVEEGDTEITVGNVTLLIDPMSYSYLVDATIDYVDDGLNGSSFIIRNPGAKSSCGCGSSFTA